MSFPKQKSFTVDLHGIDIGREFVLPRNVRVLMECSSGESCSGRNKGIPVIETSLNFTEDGDDRHLYHLNNIDKIITEEEKIKLKLLHLKSFEDTLKFRDRLEEEKKKLALLEDSYLDGSPLDKKDWDRYTENYIKELFSLTYLIDSLEEEAEGAKIKPYKTARFNKFCMYSGNSFRFNRISDIRLTDGKNLWYGGVYKNPIKFYEDGVLVDKEIAEQALYDEGANKKIYDFLRIKQKEDHISIKINEGCKFSYKIDELYDIIKTHEEIFKVNNTNFINLNKKRSQAIRYKLGDDCRELTVIPGTVNLFDFPPDKDIWRKVGRRVMLESEEYKSAKKTYVSEMTNLQAENRQNVCFLSDIIKFYCSMERDNDTVITFIVHSCRNYPEVYNKIKFSYKGREISYSRYLSRDSRNGEGLNGYLGRNRYVQRHDILFNDERDEVYNLRREEC